MRLDPRLKRELKRYSTEQLRQLYHERGEEHIRLRDAIATREELLGEIDRREAARLFYNGLMIVLTLIAAIASVVAAVESYHP